MVRAALVAWLILTASLMTGLYLIKHKVKDLEVQLAGLNRQITQDQAAIHVLKAEWAYRNQLDKLEDLARRLLSLETVTADQIVTFADLPPPRAPEAENGPPAATPADPRLLARMNGGR
ncbi:MAG: hypothetical protein AB7K86_03865 [Rhodospirillales bacterium]